MKTRKKLFVLIPLALVIMLSFVSIDTRAAGNSYSNKANGTRNLQLVPENGGSILSAQNGDTSETEGSTESGKSAAENKVGAPEGEVGNSPISDTAPETNTSGADSSANQVYIPTSQPANTSVVTPVIKGENRIDCINIDNENNKARIYFHLDETDSNVQFWLKSSGKLVKLDSNPEFSDNGYKKLEEDSDSGIHYYFVIDTKNNLAEQYIFLDLKGQLDKLLGNLGTNDCISLFTVSEEGTKLLTEGAIYNNEEGESDLSAILDSIEYNSADTNIYNGLYDACCQIGLNSDINSRDVVVAVSDGISQKNSVETEVEDKKEDPLYYALREYGMSLYFIKLSESTEYTDGKSDFISGEIDTEEPIDFSANCVESLRSLLVSDCYVAEVKYENPKVAWPLFVVSFDNEESTETAMSDSVSKYRFYSEYLTASESATEEVISEEIASEGNAVEEATTEEKTVESTTSAIEQNDPNPQDVGSEKSGLLKNKWIIFAAAFLVLLVLVIIIIAKKKNNK